MVAAFLDAFKEPFGERLTDDEPLAGLPFFETENGPDAVLGFVEAVVGPLEIPSLTFPQTGVGHDQHVIAEKLSLCPVSSVHSFCDPAPHEEVELAVFPNREDRSLGDGVGLMLEHGQAHGGDKAHVYPKGEHASQHGHFLLQRG